MKGVLGIVVLGVVSTAPVNLGGPPPMVGPTPAPLVPADIFRAAEGRALAGTMTIADRGEPHLQRVRVIRTADGRSRREYLGPGDLPTDVVVVDGTRRWHHARRQGYVTVGPVDADVPLARRLPLIANNYRFEVMGQTRALGRLALLVQFMPRWPGNMTHRLWVDFATHVPLVVERRGPGGELVDRCSYITIDLSPKLGDSLFLFLPPVDAAIRQPVTVLAHGADVPLPVGLAFRPAPPTEWPSGYQAVAWQVFADANQVPTVAWRAHDGLGSMTLFATEARRAPPPPRNARAILIGAMTALWLEDGPDRMLRWTARDTAYSLVGHLGEADFLKVAKTTL